MSEIYQMVGGIDSMVIGDKALQQMAAYRQTSEYHTEAGGVLIGRKLRECGDWVVDEVTEPQELDHRRRFGFFRAKNPHQSVIDQVWKQSQGTLGYLGEWHTHPESHPKPSGTDFDYWKKALQTFKFEGDTLFFAILGTESLAVFQGSRKTKSITMLCPKTK